MENVARKKGRNLKCGPTKSYISRIENDASDIRLSTLMRIIYDGLGAKINFQISK